MKKKEIIDKILQYHPNIEHYHGCDEYKSGFEEEKCTGIVSALVPTMEVLKKAVELGCNLLVVHEPIYYQTPDFPDWKGDFENSVQKEKEAYIREHRLTVWRDHDHMHTHQPDSIFAGVIKYLGWESYFNTEISGMMPFFYVFDIPECTVSELGEELKEKIGMNGVRIVGNQDDKKNNAYSVEKFVEKPDLETAKSYLADGTYLWNSGMFVWKVSTILDCFKKFMPDTYEGLLKIKAAVGTADENAVLEAEFPNLESQSVDYGIMEKADSIYTLPGNFGWDDVGSWLAVGRVKKNDDNSNVINGNVVAVNTRGCVIEGGEKLIATVGLRDIVVVDTKDATLITTKENAGEIKQVLAKLREEGKNEYL